MVFNFNSKFMVFLACVAFLIVVYKKQTDTFYERVLEIVYSSDEVLEYYGDIKRVGYIGLKESTVGYMKKDTGYKWRYYELKVYGSNKTGRMVVYISTQDDVVQEVKFDIYK